MLSKKIHPPQLVVNIFLLALSQSTFLCLELNFALHEIVCTFSPQERHVSETSLPSPPWSPQPPPSATESSLNESAGMHNNY